MSRARPGTPVVTPSAVHDRFPKCLSMMNTVVLHGLVPEGAAQDEADVLVQAGAVSTALAALGHLPRLLALNMDLQAAIDVLLGIRPRLVFNLVETINGSGRFIHFAPSILEHLRIPFTGARADAIQSTSNKLLAKRLLDRAGIRTPPWFEKAGGSPRHPGSPFPAGTCLVKSVWEHASIGIDENSLVQARDAGDLMEPILQREAMLGGEWFAESFIQGREFNISLIEEAGRVRVLPPAEILFRGFPSDTPKIVGYRAKWETGSFEFRNTPRTFECAAEDKGLLRRLSEISMSCWELFGLNGYARVDFRVDGAEVPWVLEVNANPCLSPDAGFIAAAARAGLSYTDVIDRIASGARCG